MRRIKFSYVLSFCLCLLCAGLLAACQPSVKQAAYPLPQLKVGIAPFSQPSQASQLMAGYIPEKQGLAGSEEFLELDSLFASKLRATGRSVSFLTPDQASLKLSKDQQGRNSVLAAWVEQARAAGVELLIVPQVLDWQRREGGPSGVTTPAAVVVDFFLIDARGEGMLVQRSHYQMAQQALTDNLLTIGDFMSRKGRWVSAVELAGEGMEKAIKEFGLNL